MKGSFLRTIFNAWQQNLKSGLEKEFNDFPRHGFPFAIKNGFDFRGVILPDSVYWMDVGDLGKLWLAIMDTLDGYFDRSMWPIFKGLPPLGQPKGRIQFVHPTAFVDPHTHLIPPYFIGEGARIGANVYLERAVVSSFVQIGDNARVRASAILETSSFNQGDKVRAVLGSGTTGGALERSLLASGTIHHDQHLFDSVAFTSPEGRTVTEPIGMNRDIAIRRALGERLSAVE